MADFYQNGAITTLHRLVNGGHQRLERELEVFSRSSSIGLVLPALYSEFETPAMQRIVSELRYVRYVKHIVVALGRANMEQYLTARSFFEDFDTRVTVLWIDSDPVQKVLRLLESEGMHAGEDGKGRSCWLSYGYLLASGGCDVVALHDCDIVNYDRAMLARLCYPVVNPNLGFHFSKGYYSRVTNVIHGRVTRLFLTPLLRSLDSLAPGVPFIRFLDSFRYALAGEFAMKSSLACLNRIPSDWGLEVGVLAEVYRHVPASRICQVDVMDTYEHKHQHLSQNDPGKGLRRMTRDIAKSLFRTMAAEGVVLGKDHFRTLEVRYVRLAEDTINQYYADAVVNGLQFNRHTEELAVSTFARSLREAAEDYLEDPLDLPLIPNWNSVLSAIPDALGILEASVRTCERTAEAREREFTIQSSK